MMTGKKSDGTGAAAVRKMFMISRRKEREGIRNFGADEINHVNRNFQQRYLCGMPVISMFYGLIVMMYYLDNKQHKFPHIHVRYGEDEAVFRIPDGELIEGKLPSSKRKIIEAWIEIHQEDLMADWDLAVSGNEVFKIDPLK